MTDEWILRHSRIHRVYRRGVCPVLEVTVTYPVLDTCGETPSSAILRFNEAYRAMAEGYLSWAEGDLLERVTEEFETAGVGAVYRFDRRRAACSMVASVSPFPQAHLLVARTVSLEGLGGRSSTQVSEDTWRRPDLTLAAVRGMESTNTGEPQNAKRKKSQNIK